MLGEWSWLGTLWAKPQGWIAKPRRAGEGGVARRWVPAKCMRERHVVLEEGGKDEKIAAFRYAPFAMTRDLEIFAVALAGWGGW